jgi:hypothetical protein
MRSRTTFKKRQKELARQEKQRDKAARRLQRKLQKHSPEGEEESGVEGGEGLEVVAPSNDAQTPGEML